MKIKTLQNKIYKTACGKGWWEKKPIEFDENDNEVINHDLVASKLALVHAEVSEGLEELRKDSVAMYFENGKPEGMIVELADAVIRIMDLCESMGLDLEEAIHSKIEYNETRPYKHGGKSL